MERSQVVDNVCSQLESGQLEYMSWGYYINYKTNIFIQVKYEIEYKKKRIKF